MEICLDVCLTYSWTNLLQSSNEPHKPRDQDDRQCECGEPAKDHDGYQYGEENEKYRHFEYSPAYLERYDKEFEKHHQK